MEELARGVVRERSREAFLSQLAPLITEGADAMVLGCTEIPMLIRSEDSPIPVLDTLALHADAAVAWMTDAHSPAAAL